MSTSYAQIIRQPAQQRPDAPALTFGGETWTFAQLNLRMAEIEALLDLDKDEVGAETLDASNDEATEAAEA